MGYFSAYYLLLAPYYFQVPCYFHVPYCFHWPESLDVKAQASEPLTSPITLWGEILQE
jgi:hypothetical protein